ncbi:MAG: hypothetical protein ACD_84C00048G0001 [uncultured bacterium]|nr:MAG: hypothetical protein ACD_84C00048G0001 [uncultured bacterium]
MYPFDPTGQAISNLVVNEQQIVTAANGVSTHLVVPLAGPYFADSLTVSVRGVNGIARLLTLGVDYIPSHWFISASRACAAQLYGSISFLDSTIEGIVILQYQTVGGEWTINANNIASILSDILHNPIITAWEQVTDYPNSFPVINHQWQLPDMVGLSGVLAGINDIELAIRNKPMVTAQQLGVYTAAEIDVLITSLSTTLGADAQTEDVLYFMGQL